MCEDLNAQLPLGLPAEPAGAGSGAPPLPSSPVQPAPAGADASAGAAVAAVPKEAEGEEQGAGEQERLQDWKNALREDFEQWMARLEEIPDPDDSSIETAETPDLYSFYEQLAAANAEARKANRRSAEAISQWGETLASFDSSLAPLRETIAQLAAAQPQASGLSRAHCLALIEILDRLRRISAAFETSPRASGWWGGATAAWRKAWDNQRQAFEIVVSHLAELLRKEGVETFPTLGQPFDPTVMNAVAVEVDASRPHQTVIEELAAGYRRHGELLRTAQVKVTRKP